jgi:hypothetical protein
MIEAQLPSDWRELGQAHGIDPANAPAHLGSKVKDPSVLLRLVLFHVGTNTSLKTTTAMAAASGLVDLSSVALHKWMRKMGAFLAALLAAVTNATRQFAADLWGGYDILIVDATSVERPATKGTDARVHYVLRLTDLQRIEIQVTDEKEGESFRRFVETMRPGQLWIGDRGYANPPGIAAVVSRGADVLVRYARGSLPLYDVHGELLDVPSKVSRLHRPGQSREWAVWVHPRGEAPIGGRLCAVRLPDDKAEEARQRLRREMGSKVTAESLDMAAFVIVFVTAPKARLSTEQVIELYRLRWQIELTIKRDKSIAGLDRLPNFRDDTIRSWILAKLLLSQIAHRVSTPNVQIPPCAESRAA